MVTTRGGSNPTILHANSAAAIALYTGVIGELNLDATNWALVVQDGISPGGIKYQASAATALSASATSTEMLNKINELMTKLTTAKLMG